MKTYSTRTHKAEFQSWRRIAVTLFIAFLLEQLPWDGWLLLLRPDFVLVMLLFWAQRWPQKVGLASAFFLGLMADVQDGVVLGQHALAYCVGVFLVQYFSRRLIMFTLPRQAVQIFPLLLLTEVVALVAGWVSARSPQNGWVFLSAITGTLLWWGVATLGKMPAARPDQR